MTQSSNHYRRVKEVALAARALDGPARAAYLDEACAGNETLRRDIDSLLSHDSEHLSAEASVRRAGSKLSTPIHDSIPETIGPYRVLRELGHGGMGVVYEAEQSEPLRRRVAIKRLRGGFQSERQIARFEAERQTLALMEHPGIATVFDAGTDEEHRPYVVMELVDGLPINGYCDSHKLGIRERLELFREVCDAVQHAHQRGVMHRDLKPSNVLVGQQEGRHRPKVIDFGIARETGALPEGQGFTAAGELIGTLEFMSPEQASGRPEHVDSRTDVYSLGVILYELLTGELPFPVERFQGASLSETLRVIQEDEPPRPSTRITRVAEATALARRTQPAVLRRHLRDDLDWIVLRALAKDPERRYASVAMLSDDILRHLKNEPIAAGAPTRRYLATKFVRRNRAAVTAAAAVFLVLLAGVAGTAWQAVRATREQARAERSLDDLRTLANQFIFGVHDQVATLPGATNVREYIVRSAADILDGIADDNDGTSVVWEPLVAAYTRLGDTQMDLGQTEEGRLSLTRATEVARAIVDRQPGNTQAVVLLATAQVYLGRTLTDQGQIPEGLAQLESALSRVSPLAEAYPDSTTFAALTATIHRNLGFILVRQGRAAEALVHLDVAVELREGILSRNPADATSQEELATEHAYRAEALGDLGRGEEGLEAFRRSAAVYEGAWKADPENVQLLSRFGVLTSAVGWQLGVMNRHEESLVEMERSLELRRRLCAMEPDHAAARRDFGKGYLQVGDAYLAVGRPEEAIASYREGHRICTELAAADSTDLNSPRYLTMICQGLANAQIEMGRFAEAEAVIDEGHQLNEKLLLRDPGREEHHQHRSQSYWLSGLLNERRAAGAGNPSRYWSEARGWYSRSLESLRAQRDAGILPPYRDAEITIRESEIARCDSALTALRSNP